MYPPGAVSRQELFRPFGDRLVFHTESGEKVLLIGVEDVEDLIYWHEVGGSLRLVFGYACAGGAPVAISRRLPSRFD